MLSCRCGGSFAAVLSVLFLAGAAHIAAQTAQSVPLGAGRPETPGVTRTPMHDDAKSSAVRVHFEPGAKEPPHTHPYDVLLVPLVTRPVEFIIGDKTIQTLTTGVVQVIPRDVTHSLANVGREPLEFVTVALK